MYNDYVENVNDETSSREALLWIIPLPPLFVAGMGVVAIDLIDEGKRMIAMVEICVALVVSIICTTTFMM